MRFYKIDANDSKIYQTILSNLDDLRQVLQLSYAWSGFERIANSTRQLFKYVPLKVNYMY